MSKHSRSGCMSLLRKTTTSLRRKSAGTKRVKLSPTVGRATKSPFLTKTSPMMTSQSVLPWRICRYVPRSARTEHAFLPSFQTNENGRGLLAWRQQQQNVATYLRYGVGRQKALNAYLQRSKKPRNATTVKSVNSSTCTICRKKRRVWYSGTTTAGPSSVNWKCLFVLNWKSTSIRKLKVRSWWTVSCGKNRSLGQLQRCNVHHIFWEPWILH